MREKAREHEAARQEMREAFVELLFWAERNGCKDASRIQHRFWDGNQRLKEAFAVTYILTAAWEPDED